MMSEAKVIAIKVNVRRAFTCSGERNSETLSDTASRPVREALPFANAFKIMRIAAKVIRPCSSPRGSKPGVFVEYSVNDPFSFR